MKPLKYVSIDLETTGLDPRNCYIIEFGAVLDVVGSSTPVEELPKFHVYIKYPLYVGQAYALSMHPAIFRRIAVEEEGFNYAVADELGARFAEFLLQNGYATGKDNRYHIVGAGKNFGSFDYRFLLELHGFMEVINIAHRSFDPGSMFFNPRTMEKIPGMPECLKLAGLPDVVRHTAVEDAQDVIRLLRYKWQ